MNPSNDDIFFISSVLSVRSISFLGVSTFAFISGYYGVKLRWSKFYSYWIMAITWGILLFTVAQAMGLTPSMKDLRDLILPISSERAWYFSAYMLLLIISPILNSGILQLNKNEFSILISVFFIIEYGSSWICMSNGTNFLLLFGIYMIGQYLRRYPIALLSDKAFAIFLFCVAIRSVVSFVLCYFRILDGNGYKLWDSNHNPLIILASITLFYTFIKIQLNSKLVTKLSQYMFGIYLFHVFAISLGIIPLRSIRIVNSFNMLITVTIIVFISGLVLEFARSLLMNRITERSYIYIKEKIADFIPMKNNDDIK